MQKLLALMVCALFVFGAIVVMPSVGDKVFVVQYMPKYLYAPAFESVLDAVLLHVVHIEDALPESEDCFCEKPELEKVEYKKPELEKTEYKKPELEKFECELPEPVYVAAAPIVAPVVPVVAPIVEPVAEPVAPVVEPVAAPVATPQPQQNALDIDWIYARVDEILSAIITPAQSQRDQARAIHTWVTQNISYGSTADRTSVYTGANQALRQRRGNCFVFYAISEVLLTRAGIPNMRIQRVPTARTRHYWNLINPDGVGWHHFDTTPVRGVSAASRFMFTSAQAAELTRRIGGSFYVYNPDLYPVIVGGVRYFADEAVLYEAYLSKVYENYGAVLYE